MTATLKVRRTVTYTMEVDGREFEIEQQPCEHIEPTVKVLPDGRAVVGYLVHDEDCSNPLDDCDGMGKIGDARRNSSREANELYRTALGLDQYGYKHEDLKPDPLVVLLDVYEHSGECWRVHGSGRYFPDERWDVSNCAGVWVPDDCCREHIYYKAVQSLLPEGTDVAYKQTETASNVITYTLPDGTTKGGFKSFRTAILAAARKLGVKVDRKKLDEASANEAVTCASQAVEQLNKWLSGDCWGHVVETFDANNESLGDSDSCWGYVGQSWAAEALADAVKCAVDACSSA